MKVPDKDMLRLMRATLRQENFKYPSGHFAPIPESEWPMLYRVPDKVFRSREFLVMVFFDPGDPTRLSICRTELDNDGQWKDGITWDELQRIKAGVGYGESCAVEIYPPDKDVVNVANMRHLWIYDAPFRRRKENL